MPSNQVVRSGTHSHQIVNAQNMLILDWVRVDSFTSVAATVHISAGGSSEYTGVESNDAVKVFVALDGAAFGNIPDIVVVGRDEAGRVADGAVAVGDGAARAAHDVVVVVADARLVAGHGARRLDTADEAAYFTNGGILPYVLRNLVAA